MNFVVPSLDIALNHLKKLNSNTKPLWGKMNAQQMVEHLSQTFMVAIEEIEVRLVIKDEHVERSQAFRDSDKPMPRDFKIDFAPENPPLRNASLELAIEEFNSLWLRYEAFFQEAGKQTLHPTFGMNDFKGWQQIHSKHLTHHFEQFGIL